MKKQTLTGGMFNYTLGVSTTASGVWIISAANGRPFVLKRLLIAGYVNELTTPDACILPFTPAVAAVSASLALPVSGNPTPADLILPQSVTNAGSKYAYMEIPLGQQINFDMSCGSSVKLEVVVQNLSLAAEVLSLSINWIAEIEIID